MKFSFLNITLTSIILFACLITFSSAKDADITANILSKTNQFRKSKGLPALEMRTDLNSIAQKHSNNMARGIVGFGHSGFAKRNAMAKKSIRSLCVCAENVAYGASSAKEVMSMWENSTVHRRNLLGPYKYIGIGIAKDKHGRLFYTQVFGG
ncbi:MAG TPA: CAP domain-containing protein [Ferruginibacter sp.]|nr:CAP domain-containing protein [Ferruginibacter sp.]